MKEKVTVAMAHFNTPELIQLSLALWLNQTIPCEVWILDTGSTESIDHWASENVKIIHIPQCNPKRHTAEVVANACQYAQDNCTTKYLMQTHVDVYPKSRHMLEYWMSLMSESPVVGYGMSDRSFFDSPIKDIWQKMVGHSLTMVDVDVMRGKKIEWSLQKNIDKYGLSINEWDTEVTFGIELLEAGITPYLLGREKNFKLISDRWHSHCRGYTTAKMHSENYKNVISAFGNSLSFDILQEEIKQEFVRLRKMLSDSWKVDIDKYKKP